MGYKILMATMGLDIGGAETHIVELAKQLSEQGKNSGLDIRMQREDIFNAMHRI